jgi:hypothetical protein
MGWFSKIFGTGSSGSQSGTSTTTSTPWNETAPDWLSGFGGQSGDLADILGGELTGWELPYQRELYGANLNLLPYQTGAGMVSNEEIMRDILAGRDVKDTIRKAYTSEMAKAAPATSAFYNEAMRGIDPTKEANEAEANVIRSMNKAREAYDMNLGSYGINPNKVGGAERAFDIATAENIVGAREAAADQAKQDSFNRLLSAMQEKNRAVSGLGGLSAVAPLSSQGQFGTSDSVSNLLNAIKTGGSMFSTLLSPKSTQTVQKGKVSGTQTPSMWDVGSQIGSAAALAFL